MKNFTSVLVSVLLAFLLPMSSGAYDFMVDGIAYTRNGDRPTVSVTSGGNYSGEIIIPNEVTYNGTSYSVTFIRQSAFSCCTNLTSVTIPNSVTSIGNNAFEYCSALTSLTIPNSVTSIGISTFSWCSGLTSVTIGNSVTSIREKAFENCRALTSVTIGNSVTSIDDNAFRSCKSLTSITIPNSVTSIGEAAFEHCSGLISIIFGDNVKEIGSFAFQDANNLKEITCKRYRPATMSEDNIFDNTVYSSATLKVPKGSLSLYYSAPVWMIFDNIIEDGEVQPDMRGDVNGDGKVNVSDVTALVNIILGIH